MDGNDALGIHRLNRLSPVGTAVGIVLAAHTPNTEKDDFSLTPSEHTFDKAGATVDQQAMTPIPDEELVAAPLAVVIGVRRGTQRRIDFTHRQPMGKMSRLDHGKDRKSTRLNSS